jgi:hypothetical protein
VRKYQLFESSLYTLIIAVAPLARLFFFWNIVFLASKVGNLDRVAGKK